MIHASEREPQIICATCKLGTYDALAIEDVAGYKHCQDCYDALPWMSNCCGFEATGVYLESNICGTCRDHCEYVK
jgi:hypothetical protein